MYFESPFYSTLFGIYYNNLNRFSQFCLFYLYKLTNYDTTIDLFSHSHVIECLTGSWAEGLYSIVLIVRLFMSRCKQIHGEHRREEKETGDGAPPPEVPKDIEKVDDIGSPSHNDALKARGKLSVWP